MTAAEEIKEPTLKDSFKAHEQFVKCLIDAWAVVNLEGKIIKANQLFSQLVGESSRKVLKADSFDDLLKLSIDQKHVSIKDILNQDAPTRIDEVSADSAKRTDLTLIIGLFPFISPDSGKSLGSFVLIRDVTDDKKLYDKFKHTKTDSITDQLTGLFTRRYFEDYLHIQQKNITDDEAMSIIMVDIDFFKKVNDVYGHQAGDHVLKITGGLMSKTFRKSDIACRYGGEEFLVILPGTDLYGAGIAANMLRKKIEEEKIIFDNTHIPVTISCGVAKFDFKNEAYTDTMARADAALYRSKEAGRNQVNTHHGDDTIEPFQEKKKPE